MSKKKSYMNQSNLLGEGFFDKLFKLLKTDSKVKSKVKSNPKIKTQLKKLNKNSEENNNKLISPNCFSQSHPFLYSEHPKKYLLCFGVQSINVKCLHLEQLI